jgi:hypothetical protein
MQLLPVFCVLWAATEVTAALGERSPDLAANCAMNKCWRAVSYFKSNSSTAEAHLMI